MKYAWPYMSTHVPDNIENFEILKKIEPLIRDRIEKFSDIKTLFENGEFGYFFEAPKVDEKMLAWKDSNLEQTKIYLKEVHTRLETLEEKDWNYEGVKAAVWDYADKEGRGAVLWPMRVSLSGKEKSPDPFELASILGKETTLKRLIR